MEDTQISSFEDIAGSLDSMEKQGKVDLTVLGKIDNLAKTLSESEGFWMRNDKAHQIDAFIFYHAFRNMSSVLSSIRQRFVDSVEIHDNPKVVDDARLVFPSLLTLFLTVKPMENQDLNPGLRSHVLGKIRDMRKAATQARMLPSGGEGLAVNEKEISREAQNLAETFRELLGREV